MPKKVVAEFKIENISILRPDGKVDAKLMPKIPKGTLLELYRNMVIGRHFDQRAFKLQRAGRLGTYPQFEGEEATQFVPASMLRKKDWMLPTYRGAGCYFARGVPMLHTLLYWGGDDRGSRLPADQNDVPFAVPVSSHLTQAAGIAWACRIKKDQSVVLAYCGDGGSAKGDLAEALSFACVKKAPLIVIISNNHFAISETNEEQNAGQTFAQRAIGYGAHPIQADGNDVFAMWKAMEEAMTRARKGLGPTVIEAVTYRIGDHTTADDASRYRSKKEVDDWRKKDPILRLRRYLESQELWNDKKEAALAKEADAAVSAAIEEYEKFPMPDPRSMLEHVFATPSWNVEEQKADLQRWIDEKGVHIEEKEPETEFRFP